MVTRGFLTLWRLLELVSTSAFIKGLTPTASVETVTGLVSSVKSSSLASDFLNPLAQVLDAEQWLSLSEDELGIFRTPEGTVFRKIKTSGYRVVENLSKEEKELEEMRKAKLAKQVCCLYVSLLTSVRASKIPRKRQSVKRTSQKKLSFATA